MPQSQVFVILALIITIHSAFADINYEIFADDEHPNKCVINTSKGQMIVDSLESVRHPTKCAKVECGKDGWALVYTCNERDPPEECVDLDFPDCCKMCNNV